MRVYFAHRVLIIKALKLIKRNYFMCTFFLNQISLFEIIIILAYYVQYMTERNYKIKLLYKDFG